MLRLMRRTRVWYARGTVDGQDVYTSLKTADRKVAEGRLRDLEREVLAGRSLRPIEWLDFQREFLTWISPQVKPSTRKKYGFVVDRFGAFLRAAHVVALRQVTPVAISNYMRERQADTHPTRKMPVGAEGIKSDLRILRRAFSYAVQCGYLPDNPVKVPRLNTVGGKTMPFTQDEVSAMLADPLVRQRADLRCIVVMFLCTGLRISDVVGFPKQAIQGDRIFHRTQKRGKPVMLPVHPQLASAIREHIGAMNPEQLASPLLFPTKKGHPNRSMDAMLRRIWHRCGVEHGHAHRFRDTFAVRILEAGGSLYDVAKLLGTTVQVAERHYAPYVKELQERGQRLLTQAPLLPAGM